MSTGRFRVDPDIRRAHPPPGWMYSDPAVLTAARELVFAPSWQLVADTSRIKVPGQVYPFTLLEGLLDEPLLLTRDREDRVHCLSNVCTHRGTCVVEGAGVENVLRCRYHGRRFGLDGRFQFMPEFEGVADFPSPEDDLPRVPFGSFGPFLFAALAPEAPLAAVLDPIARRCGFLPVLDAAFDPARSRDYVVRANWALYVDNYLEGVHIPYVHAALSEALDYGAYRTERLPWGVMQVGVAKEGESCFDVPASSPDHGRRIAAYYAWLFP